MAVAQVEEQSSANWKVSQLPHVEMSLFKTPNPTLPTDLSISILMYMIIKTNKQFPYESKPVRFYPDLVAELHKKQKEFDPVRR